MAHYARVLFRASSPPVTFESPCEDISEPERIVHLTTRPSVNFDGGFACSLERFDACQSFCHWVTYHASQRGMWMLSD